MVSGDAEINLSFKQSQVDDVLKSMLVLDSAGPDRSGSIIIASGSARTAEIPFSVESVVERGRYLAGPRAAAGR